MGTIASRLVFKFIECPECAGRRVRSQLKRRSKGPRRSRASDNNMHNSCVLQASSDVPKAFGSASQDDQPCDERTASLNQPSDLYRGAGDKEDWMVSGGHEEENTQQGDSSISNSPCNLSNRLDHMSITEDRPDYTISLHEIADDKRPSQIDESNFAGAKTDFKQPAIKPQHDFGSFSTIPADNIDSERSHQKKNSPLKNNDSRSETEEAREIKEASSMEESFLPDNHVTHACEEVFSDSMTPPYEDFHIFNIRLNTWPLRICTFNDLILFLNPISTVAFGYDSLLRDVVTYDNFKSACIRILRHGKKNLRKKGKGSTGTIKAINDIIQRISSTDAAGTSYLYTWNGIMEDISGLLLVGNGNEELVHKVSKLMGDAFEALRERNICDAEACESVLLSCIDVHSQLFFNLMLWYLFGRLDSAMMDLGVSMRGCLTINTALEDGITLNRVCIHIGEVLTSHDDEAISISRRKLTMCLQLCEYILTKLNLYGPAPLLLNGHMWIPGYRAQGGGSTSVDAYNNFTWILHAI